jgi:hypothetical protein
MVEPISNVAWKTRIMIAPFLLRVGASICAALKAYLGSIAATLLSNRLLSRAFNTN